MTVAERIDEIIKTRGISRRKLAIIAGIPPSTLQSAMERGKGIPFEMLEKIANALSMKASDLLNIYPKTTDNAAAERAMSAVMNGLNGHKIIETDVVSAWVEEEIFSADLDMLSKYYDKLNHDARMIVIGLAKMLASYEYNCIDNERAI